MKEGDFSEAWGGVASLSIGASVVWTGMREREIPLEKLTAWMSAAPAKLAGLGHRKGAIAPGMDADFAVFDPEASFEVTKESLVYRHPISPYVGEKLYGVVEHTILRGEEITSESAAMGIEV